MSEIDIRYVAPLSCFVLSHAHLTVVSDTARMNQPQRLKEGF